MAIENARFRKPVVPGDTLRLEMTVVKRRSNVAKMAGRATVDGVLVAEAEDACLRRTKADTPAAAPAPYMRCRSTRTAIVDPAARIAGEPPISAPIGVIRRLKW